MKYIENMYFSSDMYLDARQGPQSSLIFKYTLCVIIFGLLQIGLEELMIVRYRLFFERDPDLSFYIKGKPNFDTVATGAVVGMGLGISGAVCLIYSFLLIETKQSTGKPLTRLWQTGSTGCSISWQSPSQASCQIPPLA